MIAGTLPLLRTWNEIYMCAAATAGPAGWPHIASIRLEFDERAEFSMFLYTGTARERGTDHLDVEPATLQLQPSFALHADRERLLPARGQPAEIRFHPDAALTVFLLRQPDDCLLPEFGM